MLLTQSIWWTYGTQTILVQLKITQVQLQPVLVQLKITRGGYLRSKMGMLFRGSRGTFSS